MTRSTRGRGGCFWLTVPPSHCPLWTLYQHSRKPNGGSQWLSGVAAHSGSPGPSPADCLFCPASTLSVELTAKGLETRTGRSIQGASKSNTSFGGTEKKQKNNRGEWNQTGRDWKVGAFTAESSEVRRMEKALKKSCRCRWEISCHHPLSKCMGGGVCVTRFLLGFFTTGGHAEPEFYHIHMHFCQLRTSEARKRESLVKLRPTRKQVKWLFFTFQSPRSTKWIRPTSISIKGRIRKGREAIVSYADSRIGEQQWVRFSLKRQKECELKWFVYLMPVFLVLKSLPWRTSQRVTDRHILYIKRSQPLFFS